VSSTREYYEGKVVLRRHAEISTKAQIKASFSALIWIDPASNVNRRCDSLKDLLTSEEL